ncbi:class I SAM-dependent methyltransferase [candidate division FCPU426 bacterium]|nr:class I SAM-dependent methyltransferase [candidate division FCPU426 bacterium]
MDENALKDEYDCYQLLASMHPHSGEALLDIGCGNGKILSVAVDLGLTSMGIEDTPAAAAMGKKTEPRAKIVMGTDETLPFEECHFDIVTALHFTDYFPDPESGLQEIHRVLKTGGRACIVLPNEEYQTRSRKYKKPGKKNRSAMAFHPQVWMRMVQGAGLRIKSIRPQFSPDWCRPGRKKWRWILGCFWMQVRRLMPLKWSEQLVFCCFKD